MTKPTLFYDALCPLCNKEINFLKQNTDNRIIFKDIHQLNPDSLSTLTQSDLLKRLHIQLPDGQWISGLDATVYSWSFTSYGWLFQWLRWPVVRYVADIAYDYWAERRYRKRYQCDDCREYQQ